MNTAPRILIIAAETHLQRSLQDMVLNIGYQTIGLAASAGNAAVETALTQHPDAILIDINLPGEISGIQTAEMIHAQANIPIIYLIPSGDKNLHQQANTASTSYLSIPVQEHELRCSLEMAIYKHSTAQRLEHLNQVLRAVRDVNKLITREHDVQRMLDEACKILLGTRGYRFVWIGKAVGTHISPLAFAGEGQELIRHIIATGTPGQLKELPGTVAARTLKINTCANMTRDKRYSPWKKQIAAARFHSTVAIPVMHSGTLFGIMSVYADQINFFNQEEIDLLLELADDVAFGLKAITEETDRRRAEEAARQRNAELTVLSQIGQTLTRLASPSEILERVFAEIGKVLDNRNIYITLYDKERQYISFEVYTNDGVRNYGAGRPLANGITDYIIRNNTPFMANQNIDEARRQHGITPHGRPARSFLGVPIHTEDEVIGVIALQDYENENVYSEHHLELLTTIAAQIASALENARLYSAVQAELEDRKRAEEALHTAKTRLETIINVSPLAIALLDLEDRVLLWNPAAEKMFGWLAEELIGLPNPIIPPGGQEEYSRLGSQILNGNPITNIESVRQRKDGSLINVSISSSSVYDSLGNLAGRMAIITDFTEHKRAEEALIQSEVRFRAISEDSLVGVYMIQGGKLSYVNPAMSKIFGYEPAELIGRSPMVVTHPDDQSLVTENLRRRLAGEITSMQYEFRGLRKNGQVRYVQVLGVRADLNKVPTVIGNIIDITERKLTEAAIQERNNELRTLNQIGQELSKLADPASIMELVYAKIGEVLDNSNLFIALYDAESRYVSFPVYTMKGKRVDGGGRQLGSGITDYVIRNNVPLLIKQNEVHVLKQLGIAMIGTPSASFLAVPMRADNKVLGVLATQDYDNENIYNEHHVEILMTIAAQAATALENARLYHATQRDLEERKRAEDALEKSEENYRQLFENAPIGILVIDPQGTILDINPRALEIVGSPSVLATKKINFLTFPPLVNVGASDAARRCLGAGEVISSEAYYTSLWGKSIYLQYQMTPIRNEHGEIQRAQLILEDITTRKMAENERESLLLQVTAARDELEKARNMLNGVMERVSDGFVAFDPDLNYTYINTHGAELVGRTAEELIGKNHWDVFPEERATPFAEAVNRAMETQQPVFFENPHVHGGRWFVNRIYPSKEGITGFFSDISERKKAELALQDSEEKFAKAFQDAPVLISISDLQLGKYVDVNEESVRASGFSREEIIGHSGTEIGWITKKDRNRLLREISTSGVINNVEMNFRKKDGSLMVGLVKGERISIAGRDCLLSVTVDITEQKRAQEALLESREQLQAVVQTANDAIITMNVRQEIAFWNEAAENMFGYSAGEMVGKPITQIVPANYNTHNEQAAARAISGSTIKLSNKTIETFAVNKSGREFPVEISFAGWEVHNDRFITAILRDTTERKQHERELLAITTLSSALRTAPSRVDMLPVLIEQIVNLLTIDSAAIEIIDPLTGEAVVEAAFGTWETLVGTRQRKGTGLNAIISRTNQPYYTEDLEHDPNLLYPDWTMRGIRGAAGMPLIAQENLIGFLWIGRISIIGKNEVQLLSAISDIAANAIYRATLHDQAVKSATDLVVAYDSTLLGLARALELRDQETEGHSQRVVGMTLRMAQYFGLPTEELLHIRHGAILHDVGKMGVPDSILHKAGPLTAEEWNIMRQHPYNAYKLLSPIEHLRPALDIPYCHHEKWDGSGYPRGLKGKDIPLPARLFAVVDVWDALRSDRPYRDAWEESRVIDFIRDQSGTHFDPEIVEGFMELLNKDLEE